jgi:two-component system CheB/CheR fusion protein
MFAEESADAPPDESAPPAEVALGVEENHIFPVVGIGASAGGLEAFSHMLAHLPARCGMAFVFVQHLDPVHTSELAELLGRAAHMPVTQVTDGTPIEVNSVYVIPPNANMIMEDGALRLLPRDAQRGPPMPVDHFLLSLAKERGGRAIGVILSGTGTDGTLGLKAVKAEGGVTFAQDHSARYDGMPRSAVVAGCVDFVLPPEGIAANLVRIGQHPYINGGAAAGQEAARPAGDESEETLHKLLTQVRQLTGVDFGLYKRGTVLRRIQRRMVLRHLEQLEDYVHYIQDHPDEAQALYEDVLIHVTSFFREPEVFQTLKTKVFPTLAQGDFAEHPIRLWVPGCSTGEEVYSLAIALLEFLADTNQQQRPIKIFGTDVSDKAVDRARSGRYPENIAKDVDADRLRRYFTRLPGEYQISKNIRDLCVFARQDVTRDPPFSGMDLISCRNVLIYLGSALQKRVLPIFHYALKDTGFLLLGSSETIGLFSELFNVVDNKHRIYARKSGHSRLLFDFTAPEVARSQPGGGPRPEAHVLSGLDLQREADRLVLTQYAPAGVVVNNDLDIVQSRGQTGPFLELAPGLASLNLYKMAREGLLLPLRDAVEEVRTRGRAARRNGVRVKANGKLRTVNVAVTPFSVVGGPQAYFLILFEEPQQQSTPADPSPAATPEVEAGQNQVAQLQGELSATRSYLQSIVEELEASNEELKAANEEIVSSNEELRSTNEELQTAKEELQATNEELTTVNEELRNRNRESTDLNNDLTNLLSSVQIPIVMFGQDMRIRRFTPSATRVLNLIATDVGRPMSDIKPRIDVPDLEALVGEVLETFSSRERDVKDTEGHWFHLSIRPYRTLENRIDGAVLTMVDIDTIKRSEQRVAETELHTRAVLDSAAEALVTLDGQGQLLSFNRAAQQMFGYAAPELIGQNLALLLFDSKRKERGVTTADWLSGDGAPITRELVGRRMDGTTFLAELLVSAVPGPRKLLTGIIRDVTVQKLNQEKALRAERLAAIGQVSTGLAHESRNALQRSQACLEMLAREVKDRPAAIDLIDRVQQAQQHLLRLYEEARAFAMPPRLERVVADVSQLLQESWKHLEASRRGRVAVVRQRPNGLELRCSVDPLQLGQVFRNILENALQACEDPVEIDAVWSAAELNGRPALRVVLRNNGPALTADERARIFEAFFTTKTHGTGLGMTIAQRVVESHGGQMELGPETERGAEFIITLPRSQP